MDLIDEKPLHGSLKLASPGRPLCQSADFVINPQGSPSAAPVQPTRGESLVGQSLKVNASVLLGILFYSTLLNEWPTTSELNSASVVQMIFTWHHRYHNLRPQLPKDSCSVLWQRQANQPMIKFSEYTWKPLSTSKKAAIKVNLVWS